MTTDADSRVTAQRMTAAFDAVQEIIQLVDLRRDDLMAIPSGQDLVRRADATRRALDGD